MKGNSGFALVVAITLMALILLLLISLSALVRVELRASKANLSTNEARQNLYLGLQLAISQLQRYTGPDTRATARAGFISDEEPHPDHRFWIGVWDSKSTARPREAITWLVSANHSEPLVATPESEPASETIPLLESEVANAPENEVKLPRERIVLSSNLKGHFAYWISDESLKTKANIVDPYYDSLDHNLDDLANRRFARLISSQGTGIQRIKEGEELEMSPSDTGQRRRLEKTLNLSTIPWVNTAIDTDVEEAIQEHWHDITTYSFGVLSDTQRGGLRKDLTRAFEAEMQPDDGFDGEPLWWRRMQSYYQMAGANSLEAAIATEDTGSVLPIIVKINHHMGLLAEEQSPEDPAEEPTYALYTGLHVSLSLHNPYNVALEPTHYRIESVLPGAIATGTELAPTDRGYAIYLPGLPQSQSTQFEQNRTRSHHVIFETTEPLALAPGETIVLSSQPMHMGIPSHQSAESGEILAVLRPGVATLPTFIYHPLMRLGTPLTNLSEEEIFGSGNDPVLFRLRTDNPAAPSPMGVNLYVQSQENGEFDFAYGFRRAFEVDGAPNPRLEYAFIEEMGNIDAGDGPAFGFFLVHDVPTPRQKPDSVAVRNLADINIRASIPTTLNNESSPNYWHYGLVNASSQSEIVWSETDFPQNIDYFIEFDGVNSVAYSGPTPLRDGRSPNTTKSGTILFDVPVYSPISIGSLRHAQIFTEPNTPTYSVGSSYAPVFPAETSLNNATEDPVYQLNQALWDRYFFSSVPTEDQEELWSLEQPLPNARLIPYYSSKDNMTIDRLRNFDTASAHLLIDGPFNINSTSPAAWRGLLASLRGNWDTPNAAVIPRSPRSILDSVSGIYSSIDITEIDFQNSGRNPIGDGTRQSLWNANRMINDDEIDLLANFIADEVKRRGPFLSLSEFVNRSLEPIDDDPVTQLKGTLQFAIDQGPIADETRSEAVLRLYQNINRHPIRNDAVPQGGRDGLIGVGRPNSYPDDLYQNEPRSADAPTYLTQGDLLAAFGPILSVRGDTFVIRLYGDSVESHSGRVKARVWAEVVLQRTTRPITPESKDPDNERFFHTEGPFGRAFIIKSFRWLRHDEV